jgi:hypothetical protein
MNLLAMGPLLSLSLSFPLLFNVQEVVSSKLSLPEGQSFLHISVFSRQGGTDCVSDEPPPVGRSSAIRSDSN